MTDVLQTLGIEQINAEWPNFAKCRGANWEMFFDLAESNFVIYDNAKLMCHSCLVEKQCAKYGARTKSTGIFGGVWLERGVSKELHLNRTIQ